MIRAAIVGIGRWGRTLVGAVQGKSEAIGFTAGYNRTRAHAEAFCAEHGIVSDIEIIPIQQINQAYDRLLKGDVRYRFVIDNASLQQEAPAA